MPNEEREEYHFKADEMPNFKQRQNNSHKLDVLLDKEQLTVSCHLLKDQTFCNYLHIFHITQIR